MSVVPELIFQTVISRGIHTLRTDSRYIDQLFRNLSQGDQDQMRSFIQSNQIDLSINHPRSALRVPGIVILLRSDNEHAQGSYLDDFMGHDTPDEFSYDGSVDDLVLGTASMTSLSGPGTVEFGPHYVLSATLNTLKVSDKTFYQDQFMDGTKRLNVHIVAGMGAGQQREISANSHNILMVSTNWTTTPDATSVFEVRNPVEEVLGQPSKLYDRRDASTILERKGGLYTNKYQLQVVGANQEQVIYLYAIIKAIFTMSRIFMERQGIINFRMSGTDFVNRPEYIPELAYMRMLTIEFESPFEIFVPLTGLVENFTLCLTDGYSGEIADISTDEVTIGRPDTVITGP